MNVPKKTLRIDKLRNFYLNNSPMSVNKDLTCWKCHRSLMLYVKGWNEAFEKADTLRIRRSYAEAYMLKNTKPIIIPGELIVGQPNLEPFSENEQKEYDAIMEKINMMPPRRGRWDHLALDYQLLLDKGINGIIEILDTELDKIDTGDGSLTERYEFLLCCKIELEGLLEMCRSYADKALELADK